jgi:hypothetical protein
MKNTNEDTDKPAGRSLRGKVVPPKPASTAEGVKARKKSAGKDLLVPDEPTAADDHNAEATEVRIDVDGEGGADVEPDRDQSTQRKRRQLGGNEYSDLALALGKSHAMRPTVF